MTATSIALYVTRGVIGFAALVTLLIFSATKAPLTAAEAGLLTATAILHLLPFTTGRTP